MGVFKAYDIRGIFGKEWDGELAYRIGRCLPVLLNSDEVLVGRDVRNSSPLIFERLSNGIMEAGADVIDAGLTTTPMIYFGTAHYEFNASVMITASHNSKEYNGLKISREKAMPVGYETGLEKLEKMVQTDNLPGKSASPGVLRTLDIHKDYLGFLRHFAGMKSDLKIGIDYSNGMAGPFFPSLLPSLDNVLSIYQEPDGNFPNHDPNPLKDENVADLKKLVLENNLDLGLIFDGDADRVMFVDDRGRFVSPDLIIGLLGHYYLKNGTGTVLHDIRTSRSVSEYIVGLGGTPYMWKVGHAFAKRKLREINGLYGGELAGHYYFRQFFYCDSAMMAALLVLQIVNEMKGTGEAISDWIDRVTRYVFSGELNFKIEGKLEAMEALKNEFAGQSDLIKLHDFDGYRLDFHQWWFNIRPSNTEPYLRLVAEAETRSMMEEKLDAITRILDIYS